MASSSETNNYENIDITFADVDDDMPLVVNNEHTARNVFGGLNKIIKAIKAKFSEADEIETRRRGVYGNSVIPSKTFQFNFPESNKSQITLTSGQVTETLLTINLIPGQEGYYTHGLIKVGNQIYNISPLIYSDTLIESRRITSDEVGGSTVSYPGALNVVARIVHPSATTTCIEIVISISSIFNTQNTHSGVGHYYLHNKTFTYSSQNVSYELY